jgi:hypothetical protein
LWPSGITWRYKNAAKQNLERFRVSVRNGSALSLVLTQFPDAKRLRTFAGIAVVATHPTDFRPIAVREGLRAGASEHLWLMVR